jgi:hypothetical protein
MCMKIYLLFSFLMISLVCYSQDVPKIGKNGLPLDSKIISLSSDLRKDELFSAAGKVLFENGYELKSSDQNIGMIQTDDHIVKGSIRIRLSVSVEDGAAKVRGRVIVPGAINNDLLNLKGMNGIYLLAFSEMDRIAKLIPHSSIKYQR